MGILKTIGSGLGSAFNWAAKKAQSGINSALDFADKHHEGIGQAWNMAKSAMGPAGAAVDAVEKVLVKNLPEGKFKDTLNKLSGNNASPPRLDKAPTNKIKSPNSHVLSGPGLVFGQVSAPNNHPPVETQAVVYHAPNRVRRKVKRRKGR